MKESFGLYLILSNPRAGYEACAQAAVSAGVRYLQLRMKKVPRSVLLETARLVRKITCGTRTRFIVNDDISAAIEVDADGVHLGQGDMPLATAREEWNRPGKIFGLSTHNARQELAARAQRPDYIGIGPIHPTRTKPDADPALGPVEAGRIAKASPLTAVAIGGIHAGNLPELLRAGIENFCVVGAVNDSPDPAAAIAELLKIWRPRPFCT